MKCNIEPFELQKELVNSSGYGGLQPVTLNPGIWLNLGTDQGENLCPQPLMLCNDMFQQFSLKNVWKKGFEKTYEPRRRRSCTNDFTFGLFLKKPFE